MTVAGMSGPRGSVSGMNLPKRLSGRRNRTEYPDQAEDAAGPDPEQVAHLNWVAATVGEDGWAPAGRAPELILCGLPVEGAASIINAVGARVADGMDLTPDTVLDDVCPTPL